MSTGNKGFPPGEPRLQRTGEQSGLRDPGSRGGSQRHTHQRLGAGGEGDSID